VGTGSLSALSVYDWDGHLSGHGTAAVPLGCCTVVQSPDGSVLEVGTSTGAVILGRLGNLVQNLTGPLVGGVWAEDDVHSCVIEQDGRDSAEGNLYVVGPGSQSRKVATLSGFGPHEGTGVLICSVAGNFAILATSFMGGVEELIKIRLTDGTTVWEQKAGASTAACVPSQVISQADTYEASGSTNQGVVCDLATGKVVARLHGEPLAISWAGHVVIESLSTPPNTFSLEAVDWQTGTVLWRNQSAAERNGLVPEVQAQDEPNADAIALTTVPNPGADFSQDIAELWLIRPGYPALELSNQAEPGVL
jgi:outer membrane protein assembly factor BamB